MSWRAARGRSNSVAALAIDPINGILVAALQLNALIVTLAVGAITTGVTLW